MKDILFFHMLRTTIPDYLPLERPLIIFDLETTGLSVGEDKIIELAYEKILPSGEIISYCQRINPGRPISPDGRRVPGGAHVRPCARQSGPPPDRGCPRHPRRPV